MVNKCDNCKESLNSKYYEVKQKPTIAGALAATMDQLKHFCSRECICQYYCE